MADPVRVAPATSLRRDAVLEAVAFAAERFLRATGWRDVATEVLARLGDAAGVSRAYVVENGVDPQGLLTSTWVAEWSEPGVAPLIDDPHFKAVPWVESGFGRWATLMAAGGSVVGPAREFPPPERATLESHGVVSVVSLPVVVDGEWWGAIGFDDCHEDRDWSGAALDALGTAANLLSAAVERERRDGRLRDAELRYRRFIETIPAVTYTDVLGGDPPGSEPTRVDFVSPQIEAILGYPGQAFVDDPDMWFRVMHPDDVAELEERGAFDARDPAPFDEEYRMLAADGREVWVHDTSVPVRDDDGTIAYFQGFLTDVTDRRRAEEELRAAQERFRVLVERMPAVIYAQRVEPGTSRGVAFEYVSPFVETMIGMRPDEVVGVSDPWRHLLHPDDVAHALGVVAETDASGAPMSMDYRLVRPDGRTIWIHEEAVLIRDAKGRATHWQGFLFDVTERMDAAEQIRVAEERFRSIVEHTPAITYQESAMEGEYGLRSSIPYVSPQLETILGYTPAQWAGPGFWASVTHPEDLPAVLELGDATSRSGDPYRQDYRMFAADGRVVWFHDEANLIRDVDGTPLFWQGVMVDITERKLAEVELARAQTRLQALIEHIPAVVYTQSLEADTEDFWVSPQVESIFGYTSDEWAASEDFWVERIHPDDVDRVLGDDAATDATLETFSSEYRFRKADGTYAWVLDEAVFVPNVGETGRGFWQGLLFDITARRQIEEQLRDAERVFRATVEHLPAIVYREAPDADPGGLYLSPQVEHVTGWTAAEWQGTKDFWKDHLHPDDRARVLAANDEANASRVRFAGEYRFLRRDGSWIWLHDEATFLAPGPEDQGDGFWQGFLLDVTARKQAEEQMREAEEKFRTIVEQNQAIFYIQEMDPGDPRVSLTTYIAPGNTDLIGYGQDEIVEDPGLWRRIIHPEDRDRVLAADAESNLSEMDHFSMEYRMIRKDGRIVWVQDEARLIRLEDKPPYWQGFLLDITERKQAEDQLAHALEVERDASARLRALDEMKNTFLQAVSHDLRTPLAAILGLAITLERDDVEMALDESRDLAHRIADNARRLDRLVTNLLDLDRLARGIVAPKLQPTDVGSLVRRVVAESELIADSRLHTDIEPITIAVDGSKVERIVENLLANTARHTPAHASIWVAVRAVDGGVLIAVEDNGPGVAPELRETIFEPFQQGPDAPQHSPGVGVGLTLVRRFAELHGGRAWVEDRDEGGASFRVFLPERAAAADASPEQTPPGSA